MMTNLLRKRTGLCTWLADSLTMLLITSNAKDGNEKSRRLASTKGDLHIQGVCSSFGTLGTLISLGELEAFVGCHTFPFEVNLSVSIVSAIFPFSPACCQAQPGTQTRLEETELRIKLFSLWTFR